MTSLGEVLGFPDSSAGKESTCNAGDPGLIPGLGRYPGEGKGHPLQYSGLENSGLQRVGHNFRASLVAQLVKSLPAVRETSHLDYLRLSFL